MMKICLLYPLWTEEYGTISHFARKAGKWPPLNLALLGAYAVEQGHQVKIIDGEAEGIAIPQMVLSTAQFCPDLIGITATTPFYHIAVELGEALKSQMPKVPIAIGGPHITVLREAVFNACFDFAFIGESDNSWSEFLAKYQGKQDIRSVRGILYRQDGDVRFTGEADAVQDLNEVPLPARHLLNNSAYFLGTEQGIKKFTTIMTVRGCPFKCIFCSTKVFGNRVRKRSPELVIREMQECIEKHGIEHFMFLDDTLTLYRSHVMAICNLIIQENLGITFEGSTRANLVDEELIRIMKEAGLIRLSYGLESVDETIRTTMRKHVPLESYVDANRLTNKYGIETLNSCMIGLPGESIETIKKTLAFLRKSKEIKQANISIAVPYPGTELYDMAQKGHLGLQMATTDFSHYRRYNAAVMTVGALSPEDLIAAQNEAFASIYLAPWRWEPMTAKSGLRGALLTAQRLAKSLKRGDTRFLTNSQLGVEEAETPDRRLQDGAQMPCARSAEEEDL